HLNEIFRQVFRELVVLRRKYSFRLGKDRFLLIRCLQEKRNQGGQPAVAVNDVGGPAKFFNDLECRFTEKDQALSVIVKKIAFIIAKHRLAFKEILIVHKIDLKAGVGKRGHFDKQRVILFVDHDVDPGEAHYFVKAVPPLINDAEPGHNDPDFHTCIEGADREAV